MQARLQDRFQAVLSLVPRAHKIADIGFDHGDFLVLAASAGHSIIGVERQAACIERFQHRHRHVSPLVTERITLRCGDGVHTLNTNDAVETVTIAGLGESTISEWARATPRSTKRIVACPSDVCGTIRLDMRQQGFRIVGERLASGRGRLYPVIAWERGEETIPLSAAFLVGPLLFSERPQALKTWLDQQLSRLEKATKRFSRAAATQRQEAVCFRRWLDALQEVSRLIAAEGRGEQDAGAD